jgi:hypothetical protein
VIVVQCCQKYISKDKDFQATTLRAVGLAKHVSALRDNGAALPKPNHLLLQVSIASQCCGNCSRLSCLGIPFVYDQ